MCLASCMNSCMTYEWVMSHVWMSHVTYMNESCHIYEWVMSHVWMRIHTGRQTHEEVLYRTFAKEPYKRDYILQKRPANSYRTPEWVMFIYEWVMSHIWMSHVTHMNASCHTYECVMSHIWMCHVWMRPVWMRHVTHMNVSRMDASCHTYKCVMYECMSYIYLTTSVWSHGLPTISKLLKIKGLFCRISSLL